MWADCFIDWRYEIGQEHFKRCKKAEIAENRNKLNTSSGVFSQLLLFMVTQVMQQAEETVAMVNTLTGGKIFCVTQDRS